MISVELEMEPCVGVYIPIVLQRVNNVRLPLSHYTLTY
jgi:hypothetical protein